jgi:hypothetical protein
MSTVVDGFLHPLTVGAEAPGVALVAIVRSSATTAPKVIIERLKDGTPDKTKNALKVSEVNAEGFGATAEGTSGRAEVTPTRPGTLRGAHVVWEFLVNAPAGGAGKVTYRLSAIDDGGKASVLSSSAQVNVPPALANTKQPVKLVLKNPGFPRLGEGINAATPEPAPATYRGEDKGRGDAASFAPKFESEDLRALLYEIFFRLDAPFSLDAAWDQQTGGRSITELSEAAFQMDPVRVVDELWARQVSEMLLLTKYGGPDLLYGSVFTDVDACQRMPYASNPCYALAYRCQDLASFGVASRGITLTSQVTAGSAAAATVHRASPAGQWFVGETDPQPAPQAKSGKPQDLMSGPLEMDLKGLIQKVPDYGPPAVHLFSNPEITTPDEPAKYDQLLRAYMNDETLQEDKACKFARAKVFGREYPAQYCLTTHPGRLSTTPGKQLIESTMLLVTEDRKFVRDNQGSTHIAFLLRARPELGQVQFFDTGALNVGGASSLVKPVDGMHKCNLDTPGTFTIRSKSSPYKGTGIFPKLTPNDAPALKSRVAALRKARPLGVARLVLLQRDGTSRLFRQNVERVMKDGTLVYMSPGVLLYGPGEDQNYALARLAWSLRSLPGADKLLMMWLVCAPTGALALALKDASRSKRFIDVANDVFSGTNAESRLAAALTPHSDMVLESSGRIQVQMIKTLDQGSPLRALTLPRGKQPPRVPWTEAFGLSEADKNDVPSFFKG